MTDDFIENIRKTLDDYKKRVLIGEVWEDASNKVAYSSGAATFMATVFTAS